MPRLIGGLSCLLAQQTEILKAAKRSKGWRLRCTSVAPGLNGALNPNRHRAACPAVYVDSCQPRDAPGLLRASFTISNFQIIFPTSSHPKTRLYREPQNLHCGPTDSQDARDYRRNARFRFQECHSRAAGAPLGGRPLQPCRQGYTEASCWCVAWSERWQERQSIEQLCGYVAWWPSHIIKTA
jgi:hypothetical protein